MILALLVAGSLSLFWSLGQQRPGLALLSAGILLFHALPMLLIEPDAMDATLRAYLDAATTIAGIASFAWFIGYWLVARPAQKPPPMPQAAPVSQGFHRLVLLALLGLLALAPGGPLGFAQAGFLRLPVDSLLFSLTYALACLAAFTTAHIAGSHPSPPWLSMGLVLLVFWVLGGRTQFAITAIAFGLVFLGQGRIRLHQLILPALATALLAALTLSFRLTMQGVATDLVAALRLTLSQLSLLEGYALAARFVDEAGYHAGHYLATLQQLLPRALFPEKPLQLSRALRLMAARDTLGGLTPGLAGEAFAVGGHICVAAIGIAFGSALALLDNAYRHLGSLRPILQALVVSLIPLLALFMLRGGFDTAIFRLAIVLLAAATGLTWRATHAPPLPRALP